MAYTRIDVAQARELIKKSNATVVDVRDPASYEAGHIPGAKAVWCNKEAEASLVAGRSAAHGPCREPPRRRCQAAGVPPRSRIGR